MPAAILPVLGLATSVAVALLFLVAGIDKLRHRALLPGVIANYRLLPEALVAPAAMLLPLAELAVAAGLVLGLVQGMTPWAPLAATALLLIFAAAMAVNIRRGRRDIDCGCGHAGLRQRLGWGQVVRNVLLGLALLPALAADGAMLGAADVAVAVAAGVALYLLLLMVEAVSALAATSPARGHARVQG